VFVPGPIRVTAVTPTRGTLAQPGTAVLQATSTGREVTVSLDTALQGDVKAGDQVTITLPDQRTTQGTVASVSSVATTGSSGSRDRPPKIDGLPGPCQVVTDGDSCFIPLAIQNPDAGSRVYSPAVLDSPRISSLYATAGTTVFPTTPYIEYCPRVHAAAISCMQGTSKRRAAANSFELS